MNSGTESVQPYRQIVFEHPIAGTRPVRTTDRMRDDPGLLARHLEEIGMTKSRPVQAYADPADMAWMGDLVVSCGGAPPAWTQATLPEARIELAGTYTVTGAYLRAIAKIGLHYALSVPPSPCAAHIWRSR